jgi:hypothetical protein
MSEEKLEAMKASLDAKMEAIIARRKATPVEQLAGPQNFWDLYAVGPYQNYGLEPGRAIDLGESATIAVYVYLNPFVPDPRPGQNACDIISGFAEGIELNFFTSNMQTMTAVPALSHRYCIKPLTPGQCWYAYYWTFTPQEAACLYETNICARVCNCYHTYVAQYSGFVRWVANLDYDLLFGAEQYTFDHPIRYMVADPKGNCCP